MWWDFISRIHSSSMELGVLLFRITEQMPQHIAISTKVLAVNNLFWYVGPIPKLLNICNQTWPWHLRSTVNIIVQIQYKPMLPKVLVTENLLWYPIAPQSRLSWCKCREIATIANLLDVEQRFWYVHPHNLQHCTTFTMPFKVKG